MKIASKLHRRASRACLPGSLLLLALAAGCGQSEDRVGETPDPASSAMEIIEVEGLTERVIALSGDDMQGRAPVTSLPGGPSVTGAVLVPAPVLAPQPLHAQDDTQQRQQERDQDQGIFRIELHDFV